MKRGFAPATVEALRESAEEIAAEVAACKGEIVAAKGPAWPSVLTDAETFPEQRAFIADQSLFKAAFCTRRAAKTFSVGLDFIEDAREHPYYKYVFLSLTREAARNQFWDDVLKVIDRKYTIGMRFNETRMEARLPNGARIQLIGADTSEKEQKKLLGGKNRKVCLDEAQDWRLDIEKMVVGTLSPSVTDLNGQIILTGTPGNLIQGFFHKVTKGCRAGKLSPPDQREPGWSVHTWTTHQNTALVEGVPMNVRWAGMIAQMLAKNPRIVQTPFFRQNYLGKWVVDLTARVYRFDPFVNAFDGTLPVHTLPYGYRGPQPRWHFVLGIDLGYFPDPSAFVLCAYHDWDNHLYLVHSWKEWRMDFTSVADKVKWYDTLVHEKYGEDIEAHVIDGANKQGVEEMRKRHKLDLVNAEKLGKEHYIELMNTDFTCGNILVGPGCKDGKKCEEKDESLALADEYEGLIWDPETKPGSRKEHEACANHLCDAALYAWRRTYTFLSERPAPKPQHSSAEWAKQEEQRMREQAEAEMESRKLETNPEGTGLGVSEDWEDWARH